MKSSWTTSIALVAFLAIARAPVCALTTELLLNATGEAADDAFGISVSGAGDVNGDGFDDFLVGAHLNDVGGADAGRAYLFHGGPGADGVPDLVLTGEAADDAFGISVSGAGDVNGDGFADILVGANRAHVGGALIGRAYLFHGGPGADAVPDLVLTGEAALDLFGGAVSGAGDANGDGFDDLLVGARDNDAGGLDAGRAYLYYGGPGADAVPDLILTGEVAGDAFGSSVSGAGDVDGDGFDDLFVGAETAAIGPGGGRAYLYYGGPEIDAVPDLVLTAEAANDFFGSSVSGAGDVNADGYDDLLVGALGYDGIGNESGRAYVFHGGPGADTTPDLVLDGEAGSDWFGYSVSGAGDVNGDGFDDVFIGAPRNAAGNIQGGRAYVYYAGPGVDALPDLLLTGTGSVDWHGAAVASAGDINSDGFADLLAGAYRNDAGGVDAGRAYLHSIVPFHVLSPNGGEQEVSGATTTIRWSGAGAADVELSLDGGLTYSFLATGVATPGIGSVTVSVPATTTGFARVRVRESGAPLMRGASSDESDGVFRIVEPHDPPAAAHVLRADLLGENADDRFGYSAAGAGDIDGDGFDDVVVGARNSDAGGDDAGRAYLFLQGPGADEVADLVLTGESAGDRFGVSVSGAGDINGDGFDDLLVGGYLNDAAGADAGRAYVFHGGPGADEVADLILSGEAVGEQFGLSVSSAGDVNGDGFDDVVIGANLNDAGGENAGRAYVFHGGPGADTVADLVLTGEAEGDGFGGSVSGAGDVNGDGFDDVIIGASGSDAGGLLSGRAYVFYGGTAADTEPDIVMTGETSFESFGISVSGAGDVNGDGFTDVLVGAMTDVPGPNTGRAYLFHGGSGADDEADLVLSGEAPDDKFGISVAGGDMNGDGYDDLFVGAHDNDSGGAEAGRAYVYYGGPGMDTLPDLVLTGQATGERFGKSVAAIGDTDGDGFGGLLAGADLGGPGRAEVYDSRRYVITSPSGGDLWNVGASEEITWLGAERADVWLSVDGGDGYSLLRTAVGGTESNRLALTVPHRPTRYARVRVTPHDALVAGPAESDSFFTVEASIELAMLRAGPAPAGQEGFVVSWRTDPGPEDLSGYRLEKGAVAGPKDWQTLVALTRETSHHDRTGTPGTRYRLTAINGLGEELVLGEISVAPLRLLAARPLPYRGGDLMITFAVAGGDEGGPGRAEVTLFDVSGRLVRRIARGSYPDGHHRVSWNGRDGAGRAVAAGTYFLRAASGDRVSTVKVMVVK